MLKQDAAQTCTDPMDMHPKQLYSFALAGAPLNILPSYPAEGIKSKTYCEHMTIPFFIISTSLPNVSFFQLVLPVGVLLAHEYHPHFSSQ